MKRSDVAKFLEKHGIKHAERVEFDLYGYTVWSYERDEKGQYVLSMGQQVTAKEYFLYEDAAVSPW